MFYFSNLAQAHGEQGTSTMSAQGKLTYYYRHHPRLHPDSHSAISLKQQHKHITISASHLLTSFIKQKQRPTETGFIQSTAHVALLVIWLTSVWSILWSLDWQWTAWYFRTRGTRGDLTIETDGYRMNPTCLCLRVLPNASDYHIEINIQLTDWSEAFSRQSKICSPSHETQCEGGRITPRRVPLNQSPTRSHLDHYQHHSSCLNLQNLGP